MKHIGTAALGVFVLAAFEACAGGEPNAGFTPEVDGTGATQPAPGAPSSQQAKRLLPAEPLTPEPM